MRLDIAKPARLRPWHVALLAASLFLLALTPRAVGVGLYMTQDEDIWLNRASAFGVAIRHGDWQGTYRSGHPGVTTMWLASLGLGSWVERLDGRQERLITEVPGIMAALEAARRPFVVASSVAVVLLVLLAWRLFGLAPAVVGGILLALDPFVVGHSQEVHLDTLLAGLMSLALLAALVRWTAGGGWPFLALCGITSGLAFVTKAPAAFLGLAVPLLAFLGRPRTISDGRAAARDLLCWGLLALGTAGLAWPALLVAPLETTTRVIAFAVENGGRPHGQSHLFFGQLVPDPGPLFYPVVLAFRLTPVAVVGLAALITLRPGAPLGGRAGALLALALGFLLFMTLGSKKIDRYLVPLFPLLDLLAGLGLWLLGGRLARYSRLGLAAPVLLLGLQAWSLATILPYPLAYYDPLLGGAPAAARSIAVGHGEGLDQAARYINTQPDASEARVAVYSLLCEHFQALIRGTAIRHDRAGPATYVVDYITARQRDRRARVDLVQPPADVVWINGLDYVRVYRVRPAGAARTQSDDQAMPGACVE